MPSFTVENRLTNKLLREWLDPKLTSGAKVISGRLPDMPNRVVSLQLQGGPGLVMDGLFDVVTFQVTARGGEDNYDDAEGIALEVDSILIGSSRHPVLNFEMSNESGSSSVYVSGIGRTGGAPQQLPIIDASSRFVFTCTYWIQVSTNLGQVN